MYKILILNNNSVFKKKFYESESTFLMNLEKHRRKYGYYNVLAYMLVSINPIFWEAVGYCI